LRGALSNEPVRDLIGQQRAAADKLPGQWQYEPERSGSKPFHAEQMNEGNHQI
jgi:hypothetical protein